MTFHRSSRRLVVGLAIACTLLALVLGGAHPGVQAAAPAQGAAGGDWRQLTDLPGHINAWVIDPNNPRVMYAGTGELGSGAGVFKSEDAGVTWRLMPGTERLGVATALSIGPAGAPTLYALLGQQIFASHDGAATWTPLGKDDHFGLSPRATLCASPLQDQELLLWMQNGAVYRSRDGGRTWQTAGGGLPTDGEHTFLQSLAFDPVDPNVVYGGVGDFVAQIKGTDQATDAPRGLYKSTDGGDHWVQVKQAASDFTAIAVESKPPYAVYAMGNAGAMFKSLDHGQTWADLSAGWKRRALEKLGNPDLANVPEDFLKGLLSDAPKPLALWLDPGHPGAIYVGATPGVYFSADDGASWSLFGAPGSDAWAFNAYAATFGPTPVILAARFSAGGWLYGAGGDGAAPAGQ
jgi:photosystem II stability/assembly factor-like uncharacterized protein